MQILSASKGRRKKHQFTRTRPVQIRTNFSFLYLTLLVSDDFCLQTHGIRTTEPDVFRLSRSECACAAWDNGYVWFTRTRNTPDARLANTCPADSSSSSRVEVYCIREGLVKKRHFGASADNGTGSGVPDDCPKLTMYPRVFKHANDPCMKELPNQEFQSPWL